ncbi:MAG: hypothetical protein ACREA9_18480 [Pyrinomonadaceae bacterium]
MIRKLKLLVLAITVIGSVMTGGSAMNPGIARTEPQRLESYVGKYPSALLKDVPSLKSRLRALLGRNYAVFMERLQTEIPIENDEGALVARGCMAHSCGLEEAVMVINLADRKLHCAILSQKFGGKFRVFSEDRAHIPAVLNRATQGQEATTAIRGRSRNRS